MLGYAVKYSVSHLLQTFPENKGKFSLESFLLRELKLLTGFSLGNDTFTDLIYTYCLPDYISALANLVSLLQAQHQII